MHAFISYLKARKVEAALQMPSLEDIEPEAVIEPFPTDAMTDDFMYVLAVCPNI
jgi:hypothetical protein